jgi:hypothetical protein
LPDVRFEETTDIKLSIATARERLEQLNRMGVEKTNFGQKAW